MSEGMDRLVGKITDKGIAGCIEVVKAIEKQEFDSMKKEFGYKPAYEFLDRDLAIDIGLHPLKKVIPVSNIEIEGYESYENEYILIFAFSYKGQHYKYVDCG